MRYFFLIIFLGYSFLATGLDFNSYKNSKISEIFKDVPKKDREIVIFGDTVKFKARLKFQDDVQNLSQKEKKFYTSFLKSKGSDLYKFYNKKFKVEEDGVTYYLVVQDQVSVYLKELKINEEIMAFIVAVGYSDKEVFLLMTDFAHINDLTGI